MLIAILLPATTSLEELWHGFGTALLWVGAVAIHELGHLGGAFSMGRFPGVAVLYPFGAVPDFRTKPEPSDALIMALSGPAANVTAAVILAGFVPIPEADLPATPAETLFMLNCVLAVMNLIPSPPFDGGRVLTASLQLMRSDKPEEFAVRVGIFASTVLAVSSFIAGQPLFIVAGIYALVMSLREAFRVRSREALGDRAAKDAMIDTGKLETFAHGTSLSVALNRALKTLQPVFPVTRGQEVLGLVTTGKLIEALSTNGSSQYVSALVEREFVSIVPEAPLADLLDLITTAPHQTLVVVESGEFRGLLFREKLLEFLVVHGIRKDERERTDEDELF